MYLRAVHAEACVASLRKLIHEHPLEDETSKTELGILRGHLARANPHSKALIEALSFNPANELGEEVMVLFNHPVQHYVTPRFYTETKPKTGKVVPTWNYAAVQVYGKAKIYCDAKSEETGHFLSKQIHDLSQHAERDFMHHTGAEGNPEAWKVSDAPEQYIRLLQKGIIGIEITIERLEGKFKMSQELNERDRNGVVEGFQAIDSPSASEVAKMVIDCKERMRANGD
ncbi:hypothetical protein E4T52_17182 [Aureobasidium sp. EXF-3400]|nr:hypothetical protein E4T52_17182 [Aureobasidium sp. EXF-3400]